MFGAWVTQQILFWSLVQGLIFGLLAMGIVLIYRSTRVINFAVGNMGLPGAALFGLLGINYNFPFWINVTISLAMGALVGLVTEVVVVKRLFHRPRVVLLIATVGIADFWRAIVFLTFPETDGDPPNNPVAIGRSFHIWDIDIKGHELQNLIVVPIVAVVLGLLVSHTTFGKSITASADNPELSRLSGVNPHVVSTVVWTIGGFLATLSMILLTSGRAATNITNLGPFTLTNALAAAVIAGMRSFPRAMVAGVGIALADNLFGFNFTRDEGLYTLLVFVAVLIALYFQSRSADDESAMSFAPKVKPLPAHVRRVWWVANMHRIVIAVVLVIVVWVTWNHETIFGDWLGFWDGGPDRIKPSQFFLYSRIAAVAVVVTSLTVITGWSGQLSLAQMAYAGIGALTGAALARGAEFDIGFGSTRILDVQLAAIPTVPAMIVATFTTAAIAAITGIGALRVRGIMLAISTFAFAIACTQYVYKRPFFAGDSGATSVVFERGYLFGWDLADQRTYFYFSLGALILSVTLVGRLRRSGVGRSIIAVRDNPDTASAYTVSPVRMKLTAFAVAGGLAGLGGALFGNATRQIRFTEAHFQVQDSLDVVNMVVIGGLGSVIGPVLGALWIDGLPTFFPGDPVIGLVTSSIGFLFVLMYFPGGFVQLAYRVRDAAVARVEHRYAPAASPSSTTTPDTVRRGTAAMSEGSGSTPSSWELVGGGLAVVAKLVVLSAVISAAFDHLVGDGGDGWFGLYMGLLALGGVWSFALLLRLMRTPWRRIGAPGTKVGYTLYLLVEPVIPLIWPLLVERWLRRDLAASGHRPERVRAALPTSAGGREVVLSTEEVTVRFGGNVAVDAVTIEVGRDEIVGLIGTNGAGKSTLMNAIGGYVPSTGSITLLGRDLAHTSAPRRAAMGLGRTFQAATLFPELTVRECVQVALEGRHRSSFTRSALFLDGGAERRTRAEADDLIDFLGLGRYADSFISDLSTGTRRIVELSGLLAVGAEVLCLDEPTAGVAQRETEAFGPLITEIRREMGASMIIIEHDMPLIMSISDRVYCLEAGSVIAEGDPSAVRHDPRVIASYLGTDARAIERSGSATDGG